MWFLSKYASPTRIARGSTPNERKPARSYERARGVVAVGDGQHELLDAGVRAAHASIEMREQRARRRRGGDARARRTCRTTSALCRFLARGSRDQPDHAGERAVDERAVDDVAGCRGESAVRALRQRASRLPRRGST